MSFFDWDQTSKPDEGFVIDETLRTCLEESDRKMKVLRAAIERRKTAEAIAEGFSSWEEYESYENEKCRERDRSRERNLKEKCALLGKTVQQYSAEHPQRWSPRPMFDSQQPECDCDEHPIPFFCPRSLVEYRSQDEPALIGYLEERNRRQIEDLKIEEGDTSRRLGPEMLERYWESNSQEVLLELPPWAKADQTLQKMVQHHYHSSGTRVELATNYQTPNSIFTEDRYDANMLDDQIPTPVVQRVQPERAIRIRKFSKKLKPADDIAGQRKTSSKAQLREKRVAKSARIQKSASRPAMRTRSKNTTKFYELGFDGVARSFRDF